MISVAYTLSCVKYQANVDKNAFSVYNAEVVTIGKGAKE